MSPLDPTNHNLGRASLSSEGIKTSGKLKLAGKITLGIIGLPIWILSGILALMAFPFENSSYSKYTRNSATFPITSFLAKPVRGLYTL